MSAIVKLAARLPGQEEANGIDHVQQSLLDDPTRTRVAIVWFDVLKVTDNIELDTRTPTIQIIRAEYIGDVNQVPDELQKIAQDAAKQRLGHEPLPFDETEVYATGPDNDDARDRIQDGPSLID